MYAERKMSTTGACLQKVTLTSNIPLNYTPHEALIKGENSNLSLVEPEFLKIEKDVVRNLR